MNASRCHVEHMLLQKLNSRVVLHSKSIKMSHNDTDAPTPAAFITIALGVDAVTQVPASDHVEWYERGVAFACVSKLGFPKRGPG